MVKVKNKKSKLSELYAKKRKQTVKTLSPFEIHINKNKQDVLGRKSKVDRGLPGIARTKAIQKRKNTLLQEYKVKDKDNIFLDRRIGEKNKVMTQEEKTMARFAAERIKAYKKKSIFNLNDEEVLTHKGQTLIDIEKFDDPKSDDEASDQENGKLDNKFVEEAHFGGGVLSKPNSEMSRKDLIDQLIAESKKRKAERQKVREQTIDLTEKLDTEWKDLQSLMFSSKVIEDKSKECIMEKNVPVVKEKSDAYDIAVRELKNDARGTPSDKLKSEEEIVKEEKEKLEKLKQDRLVRMKGFADDNDSEIKHKSADDLDSHYLVEDINAENEDRDQLHSMNDETSSENEENNKNDEDEDEENDEDDEDEDEDDEAKSNTDDNFPILKKLKELESLDKKENSAEKIQTVEKPKKKINVNKMQMEVEKLPHFYKAPVSFNELNEWLCNRTVDQQFVILERIIKSNHPKLGEGNKNKLVKLLEYLMEYLDNCCTSVDSANEAVKIFQIFDRFCPHVYDLAHIDPEETKRIFCDILKKKHSDYEKNDTLYPNLDILVIFKLVGILFPMSDFRHPVATPCMVFMVQILSKSLVKNRSDLAKGLFLCTLILENTLLSKRFSPSAINFLRGILFVSVQKSALQKNIKAIPPFKNVDKESHLLFLEKSARNADVDVNSIKMLAADLVTDEIDNDFKLRAVLTAINLLSEFSDLLKEVDIAYLIFEPILKLLETKFLRKYPKAIRQNGKNLQEKLKALKNNKLFYLVLPKKKPKALRLYEPRIEVVYDGKRHKPMSKERAEKAKLLHKLKRETKSAIREVRRDNTFLAKVQIKQQIKSDEERKRKVKEIYGDAAIQQSELKKMKRKK